MPPSTPSTPQIIDLNNTAALDLPTPTITVPSVVVPQPPPPPTRSAVVSTKGTKDTAPTPPTQSTESILPIQQSAVAAAEFEHDQQRPDKEINNITVEFKQQLSPTTTVTVDSSGRFSNNDDYNNSKIIGGGGGILLTTSTPTKLNTSMITINASDTADPSNSLASSNSVNQVTVVTSHPPVLIDNTAVASVGKDKPPLAAPSSTNEVIIVSNEMNKTRQLHESSTDEEFPSLDSLEYGPGGNKNRTSGGTIVISGGGGGSSKWQQVQQTPPPRQIHQKLDDSNVFIVNNSEYESSSSSMMDTLDTSHVSVVTVGEEIYVKDSSNKIVSDSSTTASAAKVNGLLDDVNIIVNKQKTSPDKRLSPDSSVGSLDSRSQSESGSGRSIVRGAVSAAISKKVLERNSDTESIATINSTDSRDPSNAVVDGEEVVMRRSPVKVPAPAEAAAGMTVTAPGRSKEEIELRNLRKKTRKRTRKFEIDGVQMTTTTSQVIYGDDENGRLYDDHIIRKQELRELKLLQKQEKKQFLDLQTKEQLAREQQEKRFEQERITLERTYESDMDTLARQHKQLVDKTEQHQESDLRTMSKKVRSDQERELKMVRIYIYQYPMVFL